MKNKIGLYFQLETENSQESLTIVKEALNQIDHLENQGIPVQYFELKIKNPKNLLNTNEVSLKLDGNGYTFYIEDQCTECVNETFNHAFDKIKNKMGVNHSSMTPTYQYA